MTVTLIYRGRGRDRQKTRVDIIMICHAYDKSCYEKVEAKKAELRKLYKEWLPCMTSEESELHDLISGYEEEYFDDFTFKPNSIITPYIESKVEDDGEVYTEYDQVPIEMTSLSNSYYRLSVSEIDDNTEGQVDNLNRIITIPYRNITDKSLVLHEMIHAYEGELIRWNDNYRTILTLCLYKKLSTKILDLDIRLASHGHPSVEHVTSLEGGTHSILFFLKSLDLDLHCEYKLGTVCGYGRNEF